MELIGFSRDELVNYLSRQLNNFFPDGKEVRGLIDADLDDALDRMETCVNAARMWKPSCFDPFHSEQNTIFLYYLSNTIWRKRQERPVCTKLFYLNKTLNSFSCFYDTKLPDIFFVGHSPGIVLARAEYANYLVLYQNSTVGKNHGAGPVMEEGVVMYPNSAIIGDCHVKSRTYLGQGQSLIDTSTPGNCYAFNQGAKMAFKTPKRDILADIFRL